MLFSVPIRYTVYFVILEMQKKKKLTTINWQYFKLDNVYITYYVNWL